MDPTDSETTLFYYSGGDGPHDGQRDDSIGLATAPTNAYAGLTVSTGETNVVLKTHPIRRQVLPHYPDHLCTWQVLAELPKYTAPATGSVLRARALLQVPTPAEGRTAVGLPPPLLTVSTGTDGLPAWSPLPRPSVQAADNGKVPAALVWEFHCTGNCTLFAIRQQC